MKAILMTALIAAVALAGCTSSGPEYTTPETDSEGRYVIEMLPSNRFSPAKAEVPVGATVVFKNSGGAHDTEADDGTWKSPFMTDGDEFEVTLDEAGDYSYRCNPHVGSGMTGVIRVVE